ncbi:MAG: hypothetical protein GY863_06530, partial [bacterium]|nr:hypothetical protein [bacterium]
EVHPDPRVNYTNEDYRLTFDAVTGIEEKLSVITEAVDRIRKVEKVVDNVNEQIKERDDQAAKDLKTAGDELKKKLSDLTEIFIPTQNQEGIFDNSKYVVSKMQEALGQIGSTWEKPTPAHRTFLRQAEEALQTALDEFNNAFNLDVTNYRTQLNSAGIQLFPNIGSLDINWKKDN